MTISIKSPWYGSLQSRFNGNYLLGITVDLLARNWTVCIGFGLFEVQISGDKK
jgi:hypothetical protein